MADQIKNLTKHLRRQIEEAEKVQSDWVYILKIEAEKCLELAENVQKEQKNET